MKFKQFMKDAAHFNLRELEELERIKRAYNMHQPATANLRVSTIDKLCDWLTSHHRLRIEAGMVSSIDWIAGDDECWVEGRGGIVRVRIAGDDD